jgi:hypothetical protein
MERAALILAFLATGNYGALLFVTHGNGLAFVRI